jgi:hypothetical protein
MVKLILYAALSIAIALLIIGAASPASGQAKNTQSTVQNVAGLSGNVTVKDSGKLSLQPFSLFSIAVMRR